MQLHHCEHCNHANYKNDSLGNRKKLADDTHNKTSLVLCILELFNTQNNTHYRENVTKDTKTKYNDSEQWYAREYSWEQVAGVAKAAESGIKTAEERKDYTARLKPNQLDNKVITDAHGNKHSFVEIKPSAWNGQMNQIADYYAQQKTSK